jgi:NADPH:quinone reductase-like Zn-dependent oxidoreductase
MRAIGVTQHGGPEQLTVLDLPEPQPGPGQVRIRVAAATVNPTDVGMISGRYGETGTGPWVPGAEAAGVIDAVGEGVPQWAPGDRVIAVVVPFSPTGGAYADQLVVPASQVARIPADLDLAHAATLPMNGLTAVLTLEALRVPGGGTVAVTGSAGAYGGYVVQLAKAEGNRVVADAKDSDVDLVTSLGADDVVERGDGFAAAVRGVLPDGVDGLADGAVQTEAVVGAIRDGGTMATIRGWKGPAPRGIDVRPVMVYAHASRTDALERLVGLVATGAITLRVADVVPAEQAVAAMTRFAAGGVRGRIVLDFSG